MSGRDGEPFALGIDGGGSKTLAVLVDARGHIRGEGEAGSANHAAIGIARATRNLLAATAAATSVAGRTLPVAAAWVGLAGVDHHADVERWAPHLAPLAGSLRITNDAELLLGALPDLVGVALIAGTGSIALGRDAMGATARAGGWGHLLGDEGSGFELGREALRAALRAADGRGPATLLLDRILCAWELERPEALLSRVYPTVEKADVARLSALVLAAAREGDGPARAIVRRAARELALAATAVADALTFPCERVPLAVGGGLLAHEREYRARVLRALRARRAISPLVVVERPAVTAARAALRLLCGPPAHGAHDAHSR